MRAVIQRVSQASVTVDGAVVGAIGPGLLILLGIAPTDDAATAHRLAGKISRLRIFADAAGKMNRSVVDVQGGLLVVSQFTLLADLAGNRPSFTPAAKPDQAAPLVQVFVRHLETATGLPIAQGVFGADMQVALVNDGPVTLCLDTATL